MQTTLILPISVTSEAIWGDGANVNFYQLINKIICQILPSFTTMKLYKIRTSYNILIPLVHQLNNHNSCWGAKPRYDDCGNESSMEQTFLGAKVPRHFRSRERKRKYVGTKVP